MVYYESFRILLERNYYSQLSQGWSLASRRKKDGKEGLSGNIVSLFRCFAVAFYRFSKRRTDEPRPVFLRVVAQPVQNGRRLWRRNPLLRPSRRRNNLGGKAL